MSASLSPEFVALQRALAGRYSLERELGRGGMGIVFLARDVALDRPVAIKLLPPSVAALTEERARFLREARTAAGLSHPHIVPIHAVEELGDLVFFAMAYVDGESLGQRVRRAGPLPAHEVMRITQQVAWALGHAHAHGVVHRDVKPDNVLLERGSGRALVSDFGIAAQMTLHEPSASGVVGTPQYMSPEQAAGGPVDPRSDLYSLGVTAYYAATGRMPFEASSVAGLIAKHAGDLAPPVASFAPRLPSSFSAAIDRCLAKAPEDRFASADALAARIESGRGGLQLPPPMRAFLREAHASGGEIGTALTAAGITAVIYNAFFASDGFAGLVFLPTITLLVGLAGTRAGQLVLRARELSRHGYGYTALRPAVEIDEQQRSEEVDTGPDRPRGVTRGTWVAAGVGAAVTAASLGLLAMDPAKLWLIGSAGAIIAPTITIHKLWSDLSHGRRSLWNRILSGPLGSLMFRAARLGLKRRAQNVPVVGQSTTLAVGAAAHELYRALPSGTRARFRSLPTLIDRLERDAAALRGGDDEQARERFATAVAALENLRLDLLRLHAGTGTVDDLTEHVRRAQQMGEEIDAELEGHREVRRLLLGPNGQTPSSG